MKECVRAIDNVSDEAHISLRKLVQAGTYYDTISMLTNTSRPRISAEIRTIVKERIWGNTNRLLVLSGVNNE